MNIIILGPQGSGKGTQAKLLAENFNLYYFEAGAFLRKLAKKDERIDQIINKKGEMIDDQEMFSYVKKDLEENNPKGDGIIFDGYPRSTKQYELLIAWLDERGEDIDYAFFLDIDEKESIRRLSARRMDRKTGKIYNLITNPPKEDVDPQNLTQRPDDKPEAISRRLQEYKEQTQPLVELLRDKGVLIEIDGKRPIKVIYQDLINKIENGKDNH
jgi:adenylate kinase